MSKTFSYILIVIAVYLLIIFPKVVNKNKSESEVEEKEESSIIKRETTMRGHTA